MRPKKGLTSNWHWLLACLLLVLLPGCREAESVEMPTALPTASETTLLPTESTTNPAASDGAVVFVPLVNGSSPPSDPTATPAEPDLPPPTYPPYSGPTLSRQALGVQVYLHRVDVDQLIAQLEELGVGWVKVQVSWKLYQPTPDRLSEERFAELDRLVEAATASRLDVLLGVAKAPEWSRPTTELDGPPQDSAHYQAFMQMLAQRYRGKVAAYELWNEPNLQREWNGMPLDAAALVALIRAGAEGVRAADPETLVISGAPAVTGINDGRIALDDRAYLRSMLAAGVAQFVDGIGVHPYGWANPPEATAANPNTAVPTHNNHPSFFFRDTLQDYAALLNEFGISDKQLWVTEFGWGSFEGMAAAPPAGAEFMMHVSERQQADYIQRALALAHDWPWVGPMILWNLNFAPWLGPKFSESGFSLLRPDGTVRPAYLALANIPKEFP